MKITQLKFTFTFIEENADPFDDAVVAEKMAEYMQNEDGRELVSKEQIKITASELGELAREVTIVVNNDVAPGVLTALKQMKSNSNFNDNQWNKDNLGVKIDSFFDVYSSKQEAAPGLYERLFETSFDDNVHFLSQIGNRMVRGFGGILVIIVVLSYLNFSMSGMCKKNGKGGDQTFSNKMMFNALNVLSLGLYGLFAYFTESEDADY